MTTSAAILRLALGCLLALWVSTGAAYAQEETAEPDGGSAPETQDNLPESHSPQGAVWRAAAVPGWGQLYNRQYYKVPIVWAGLGGIAASALYINNRYLVYRHAFHWVRRDQVGYDVPPSYEEDYLELLGETGLSPEEADQRQGELASLFQRNRDNLRRNRDLLYIGVGLFYGLTVLDAYVNAHLLDFDVSEDLTLSLHPTPGGFSATISPRR